MKPDVAYALPVHDRRIESLEHVLAGGTCAERYLFYGLDYVTRRGMSVVHNVGPTSCTWLHTQMNCILRRLVVSRYGYAGEFAWVTPWLRSFSRAQSLLVYSGRVMFALMHLQRLSLFPRKPTVFITMGLPEKLRLIQEQAPQAMGWWLSAIGGIQQVVTLSSPERDELASEFGLCQNVKSIPAGVDVDYFRPRDEPADVDVLSIGADQHRDFGLLFRVATELTDLSFRVVTTAVRAAQWEYVPANVEVLTDVPMSTIRDIMARARLIALPVHPNSYSGATTVLLQAMAMGKCVIANQVGASKDGMLRDGGGVVFVPPHDVSALRGAVRQLARDRGSCAAIGAAARQTACGPMNIERFHEQLWQLLEQVNEGAGAKLCGK